MEDKVMLMRLENLVTSSNKLSLSELKELEAYFLKTTLISDCPCNESKVTNRLNEYWVVRGQSELLSLNN